MSKNFSSYPLEEEWNIVMVMALNHSDRLYGYICYFKRTYTKLFVEDIGVEPMTLCVQGRCSSQLS